MTLWMVSLDYPVVEKKWIPGVQLGESLKGRRSYPGPEVPAAYEGGTNGWSYPSEPRSSPEPACSYSESRKTDEEPCFRSGKVIG